MEYVTTIATKECEQQCRAMIQSLRYRGYDGPVLVYYPDNCRKPNLADAKAELVVLPAWWDGILDPAVSNKDAKRRAPIPALLKPDIFLDKRFEYGDRVLYVDGADVLFFQHPKDLFNLATQPVNAYPMTDDGFCAGEEHTYLHVRKFLTGRIALSKSYRYNTGVIVCNINKMTGMFMWQWKSMMLFNVFNRWRLDATGLLDQATFNGVTRIMEDLDVKLIGHIPRKWNFKGCKQVCRIKVCGGKAYSAEGDTEVGIAHATGQGKVKQHIIAAAVGSK